MKRTIFVAILLHIAAMPVWAAPQGASPEMSAKMGDDRSQQQPRARAATPRSNTQRLHDFGLCVARVSPVEVERALRMDVRDSGYAAELRILSASHGTCHRGLEMRTNMLLFAGGLAEGLIENRAEPINTRLARAANSSDEPVFGPPDRFARCIVRTMPAEVATLFATGVNTVLESRVIARFNPAFQTCGSDPSDRASISRASVRAMLAAATFRILAFSNGQPR